MARNPAKRRSSIARQRFNNCGRWLLRFASLALIAFSGMNLADTALNSEMFMVRDVVVEGNCLIEEDVILQALDIPSVVHLWEVDPSLLEVRLLAMTGIKNVRVKRIFPQSLAVEIEERMPLADWHDPENQKCYAVDEDGVILAEADLLDGMGPDFLRRADGRIQRPGIFGLKGNWQAGDHLEGSHVEGILKAVSLACMQQSAWMRSLVEIRAPIDSCGWILRLAGREGEIRLGEGLFSERLGRLGPVYGFLKRERIATVYVDLRFDQQGVLIRPINCDPSRWVRLAEKNPGPGFFSGSV